MIRAAMRGGARLLAASFAFFALYFLAAGLGGLILRGGMSTGEGEVEVLLLFGPIHVDFLLPADDRTRAALVMFEGAGVPVRDPGVRHLIVGWGARDFYTTAGTYAEITPRATWHAVTGDASVLRADVVGPIRPDHGLPALRLGDAQYERLLAAIVATAEGPALDTPGHTPTDGFVAARGRFHLFRTCNTWVSDMLAAAGVEAGLWTPTPYSVRLALWRAGLG